VIPATFPALGSEPGGCLVRQNCNDSVGKEFEATTDGPKNTDVHLFVYDSSGAEVAKDDSPGPKCSVKVTPEKDGQYKFVIKNAGGANTVSFNVKVAK
jgi:hypothetical protein